MKVLIADKLSKSTEDALGQLGARLDVQPDLTADTLPAAIGDAQVLVVRSTKVTAQTISAGKQLSLIVRAGAGVNTIDVQEASQRGIYVTNCPGKNSAAVAELAIGLLIACDRRIVGASNDLRDGNWRKKSARQNSRSVIAPRRSNWPAAVTQFPFTWRPHRKPSEWSTASFWQR